MPVIQPEQGSHWRRNTAVVGAVVVIVALVGALLWFKIQQEQRAQDERNYNHATAQSDLRRGQRDYDGALRELSDYVQKARSKKYKTYSLIRMGAIYEIKDDNKAALKYYRQAEAVAGSANEVGLALGIARAAEALGDRKTAIAYYRKTIELSKSSMVDERARPSINADIRTYEDMIKRLEAQP